MLRERIIERIERDGPLPFDEFMRMALYDRNAGYFATGPLRSNQAGDFLTSPEVSPLFGETIARFVSAEGERVGGAEIGLVEIGAGSGSLLRPLLDALPPGGPVWAVEVSAAARLALAERVPEARVVDRLDAIPAPICGVVIANEVADNLPAALVARCGSRWVERRVGVDAGGLAWVETSAGPELTEWAERFAGPVPDGGVVEVQLEAATWMTALVGLVEAGSVVVFDYGDTGAGLAPRRGEGTVRTYRGHHLGPDPLLEPGSTDVTMDVDVGALAAAAEQAGAAVEVLRQAEFLERWGLQDLLAALRDRELAAARGGDVMEQLRARSNRTDGAALLHPRGLGDFRVVVATV